MNSYKDLDLVEHSATLIASIRQRHACEIYCIVIQQIVSEIQLNNFTLLQHSVESKILEVGCAFVKVCISQGLFSGGIL